MRRRIGDNGGVETQKRVSRGPAAGVRDRLRVSTPVLAGPPPDGPATQNGRGAHGDETRLRYLGGLDGLRAVSVLAVLAYHFRPNRSLYPGGFLGVEVFFVISGYLITALLLAERKRKGLVNLKAFWLRRARRLAPALAAMILATGVFLALFHRTDGDLHANRGDLLFGFWAENWWKIGHHALYTEAGVRQPLQHLWSLAVEEQFYVVWPLLFLAGMFFLGRKRLPWAIGVLAAASWIGSIVWLHTSTQDASDLHNALYMSTPSRAYGLLLGALAACLLGPERFRGTPAPTAPAVLNSAGAVALVGLALQMRFATDSSNSLFEIGFLLTDVLTLVLIVAVAHPASKWNGVLGVAPLRAIGQRSYGIYLWGVVIFEYTQPGVDLHWSAWSVLALRVVLVGAVAEVSYRFLETPIRRGALGRALRATREAEGSRRHVLVRRWEVGAAALLATSLSLGAVAWASSEDTRITNGQKDTGGGDCLLHHTCALPTVPSTTSTTTTPRTTTTTARGPGNTGSTTPTQPPVTTAKTPTTAFPKVWSSGYIVSAVGDSVMLGANLDPARPLEDALKGVVGPGVWVNAAINRQGPVCVDFLKALSENHQLGPLVLVHCGNNGTLSSSFVDDVMKVAGPKRHVVFFTVKVERPWQDPNNKIIVDSAKHYANAKVLDWHFFGTHADQKTIFYCEFNCTLRLHLTKAGRTFYINLIINTLRKWHWM